MSRSNGCFPIKALERRAHDMRSLALAAVLCLASRAAAQPAWISEVQAPGWMFLTSSDDMIMYAHPAPSGPSKMPRLWIRYENRAPETLTAYTADGSQIHALSRASLIEVDCSEGKSRMLQSQLYPGRNMGGDPLIQPVAIPIWNYSAPGTFGEAQIQAACRTAVAADPKAPAKHKR